MMVGSTHEPGYFKAETVNGGNISFDPFERFEAIVSVGRKWLAGSAGS
jgi:hypothetical protein